jgi:protein TonB
MKTGPMELRHVDVLEERDELRRPLLASLALHAAVFGLIAATSLAGIGRRQPWGDPNSLGGGGAYSVSPVRNIPIAGRGGPVNRLASDTQSQIPTPPKAEPKKAAKPPEPDAIALKSRKAQRAERAPRADVARRDAREFGENQVFSRAGQAAASPMYAVAPGSGGVGIGSGAPFGARCGGYAAILRDRVAQRWRTEQVDPRIRTLPPAVVVFELHRNGQVRNVRLVQSSGNVALDYSAQRAILEASPFEPIPPGCDGNPAIVEFWFELKR